MHWVEGFTLNAFVRDMLEKPAMLEKLSRIWVRMARRLREAGLAHCDLQHGNVLLVPASEASALAVKLIDYDGMWVPSLAQAPPGEMGHPAYQHPQRRRDGVYNSAIDRFSLLAIHVALRALLAGGRSLWERYDTGDNLLFRQADFDAPTKSPLFAELLRLNQPEMRALVVQLIDAARMPLEQTPHLADLVADEKPATRPIPRSPGSRVSPTKPAETEPEMRAPKQESSPLPWIAVGCVAACALVGGFLLWGTQRESTSPTASTQSASEQAKGEEQTPELEEKQPPAEVDKNDFPPEENRKRIDPPPRRPKRASTSEKKASTPLMVPKLSKPSLPPKPKPKDKPVQRVELPSIQPDPPPTVGGKLPVPDEAALKSTTEVIQDANKADYASKDPTVLTALAERLLKQGQKHFQEPQRRFVFLREASDVAARAGDPVLSLRAVDELVKHFDVQELPLKTAALKETARNLPSSDTTKAKTALEMIHGLLAQAIQTDGYEDAERLVKAAEVTGYRAGVSRNVFRATGNEIQRLKTAYTAIKSAVAKLRQEPNDPEANRLVGSFRCFEKGDWENGLPLLVKGDDARLKERAEKDLAEPTTADARVEIGDDWWQLGKKSAGSKKEILIQRACHWYERALPEMAEPTRTRVEARIRSYNQEFPARAWGHLDISQAAINRGAVVIPKGDKDIITHKPWSGPVEITALARTEKNNIRFLAGRGGYVIFNWEKNPEELRIARPDGDSRVYSGSEATAVLKPSLQPNSWYFLSWRLTENGMTISVNDRVIFPEDHKNDLSTKHPIRLRAMDSELEVLSFRVRPLGKKSR